MKLETAISVFLLFSSLLIGKSASELQPFTSGVNSLCIGHSFFVPIYRRMDEYVDTDIYPDHEIQEYQQGGLNGSPGSLWDNHKANIENYLKTGKINLLMMTVHESTVLDDYVKWIDLARSYNLNTAFAIGIPWVKNGPTRTTDDFNAEIEEVNDLMFPAIEELRSMYPGSPIYYLSYGYITARMRELFDDNALGDIDQLCCTRSTDIFRDESPGHQGDMLEDIAALYWLKFLYGDTSMTLPSFNQADVDAIISYVVDKNVGKNDQILMPTTAPAPTPAPAERPDRNFCFSGESNVNVKGKGQVFMRNVRVGDQVLTGSGNYQMVYAHGHRDETSSVEYLQIQTTLLKNQKGEGEKENHAIELTEDHMIFVQGKNHPVPASHVKVGDSVRASRDGYAKVNKVDKVFRNGYYNPLTADGTIVVDGIVASIYPTFWESQYVELSGVQLSFFPIHTAIDVAVAPYRASCQISRMISFPWINNDDNKEQGNIPIPAFLQWAVFVYDFYHDLQEKEHFVIQLCMFVVCGTVIGSIYLLLNPYYFITIVILIILGNAFRQKSKSIVVREKKYANKVFSVRGKWLMAPMISYNKIYGWFGYSTE